MDKPGDGGFPWSLILYGLFAFPLLRSMYMARKLNAMPSIGRLYIHGEISSDIAENKLNPRTVEQQLKKVKDMKNIKGLLIDVNSPGGAAVASGDIAKMISHVEIPTVALVRDICASGGYMVASACDEIVAQESSIVGSIGVISKHFVIEDLLKKVGVQPHVFTAGRSKDSISMFHAPTDEGKQMMKELLETCYGDFIARVSENRELPIEKVREIAEGQIYSGKKAQELGLVDHIGGLEKAIELLEQKGNFKQKNILELKKKTGLIHTLMGSLASKVGYSFGEGFTRAVETKMNNNYPNIW